MITMHSLCQVLNAYQNLENSFICKFLRFLASKLRFSLSKRFANANNREICFYLPLCGMKENKCINEK